MGPPILTTGAGKFPGGGGGGGGAVSVDATGTLLFTASVTSASYTGITVGSGSQRAMVVSICADGPNNPTSLSINWDSGGIPQSMTLIKGEDASGGAFGTYLYGLLAPTSGNKTLGLSWTGSARLFISAIAFTGVDQTSLAIAFPNATSGNSVGTLSVTSATGNKVVCSGNYGGAFKAATGTTIFNDASSGSIVDSFFNYDNGAASVSIGLTTGACSVIAAFDVKAA